MRRLCLLAWFLSCSTSFAQPPPLTVEERVKLVKAMQECWTQKRRGESGTQGGASLDVDVDGVFKKLMGIAGTAKGDFTRIAREEFSPMLSSEAHTWMIRACFEAAFGSPLVVPAQGKRPGSGGSLSAPSTSQEKSATGAVGSSQSTVSGTGNNQLMLQGNSGPIDIDGTVIVGDGNTVGDVSTSGKQRYQGALAEIRREILSNFSALAVTISSVESAPPQEFKDKRRANESELAFQDRATAEYRRYRDDIGRLSRQLPISGSSAHSVGWRTDR